MKDPIDALVLLYQEHLHLQGAVFSRIVHEDAIVAIVYKITQPNGEALILKICERSYDYLREVHFLKQFAEILPVPKIIQVVEPGSYIHGAILMECLPGRLLKAEHLTDLLAYEIGKCLACVHLNRLPGYGDPIQGPLNPDPRVYFTLKFEEGLEECRHHLPKDLLEHCKCYYQENVDLLLSLDGPCIVHRDFRPGNLMIAEGKLQGIIDWAGGRSSFAEEDFCSIEHEGWLHNPAIKKSFLAGYASIRSIPHYKQLIAFLRLNKTLATIGFTVKRGTWENTSSCLYQYNRHYLETFFEEAL